MAMHLGQPQQVVVRSAVVTGLLFTFMKCYKPTALWETRL